MILVKKIKETVFGFSDEFTVLLNRNIRKQYGTRISRTPINLEEVSLNIQKN